MNEILFLKEFTRYGGFSGLIIVVLGIYIWRTDKVRRKDLSAYYKESKEEREKIYAEHKEERDEWREQHSCQFKKLIDITNEHAKVIADFRVILKGIEENVKNKDCPNFGQRPL